MLAQSPYCRRTLAVFTCTPEGWRVSDDVSTGFSFQRPGPACQLQQRRGRRCHLAPHRRTHFGDKCNAPCPAYSYLRTSKSAQEYVVKNNSPEQLPILGRCFGHLGQSTQRFHFMNSDDFEFRLQWKDVCKIRSAAHSLIS